MEKRLGKGKMKWGDRGKEARRDSREGGRRERKDRIRKEERQNKRQGKREKRTLAPTEGKRCTEEKMERRMKRSESVTSAKKISQCLNVDKSQESGIYLSLNTSIFLASSPALRVLQNNHFIPCLRHWWCKD